jgi:hypothetical protein
MNVYLWEAQCCIISLYMDMTIYDDLMLQLMSCVLKLKADAGFSSKLCD